MRRVEAGDAVLDLETTRLLRNGQPFPVELSLRPFREPGEPVYFLEATSDIRERVRWRDSMIEIEKLASMGKMAAGTAHHLNSPLAALLLRVQLMRERALEPTACDDLARLEDGLKFCRHFVQRLLEFTRTDPVHKENLDLAVVIESVAAFFMPVIQSRRAALSADTSAARGCHVYADRNLLETLLLTLLSNALDAVSSGGQIRIETRRASGGRASVLVTDNGCGIAAGDLQHVFEPFFTTKEPGKGTGLGLAIARNLVAEHGGLIRLESEAGRGTTAFIDRPLVESHLLAEKVAT